MDKVIAPFIKGYNYKGDVSITTVRENLGKIPETLKTVSPFYDEDCSPDTQVPYWTKGVNSDAFDKVKYISELNQSIVTTSENREKNVVASDNNLSPLTSPFFTTREVKIMHSNEQIKDDVSLMAKSLYSSLKVMYANYLQISLLQNSSNVSIDIPDINFTTIYARPGNPIVKFPTFETLDNFYRAIFL